MAHRLTRRHHFLVTLEVCVSFLFLHRLQLAILMLIVMSFIGLILYEMRSQSSLFLSVFVSVCTQALVRPATILVRYPDTSRVPTIEIARILTASRVSLSHVDS